MRSSPYVLMVRPGFSVAMALLLFCPSRSVAHETVPVTSSNAAVVPPVTPKLSTGAPRPASYGTADVIINDDDFTTLDLDTVIYNIDVTGTQTPDPYDNLIGAGIICIPTITATNTGPRKFGFFGTPNDNINPPDLVIQPFASGVGGAVFAKWDLEEGNATTLLAQYPYILTGHAYLQYDTVQFPNGEIRGMIDAFSQYGDANFDGVVDIKDLYILAQHWQAGESLWIEGDFDGNELVNAADLGILAANWQSGVAELDTALLGLGLPHVSVPEPAPHLSLVFSFALGAYRRRRFAS